MVSRQELRIARISFYIFVVCWIGGAFLIGDGQHLTLGLIGLALALVALIVIVSLLRCPKCGKHKTIPLFARRHAYVCKRCKCRLVDEKGRYLFTTAPGPRL